MNILPENPITDKISVAVMTYPVKRISFSTPNKPNSGIMINIMYDAAVNMKLPELEIPDLSSPTAIIEQRKAVTVTGWSRMADSYILIPNIEWNHPSEIESWVSEIGWALGAGYMYRWNHAPGDPHKHLWGLIRYSVAGDDMSIGDASEELAELSEQYGCWSWEINASYQKEHGCSKLFWQSWYEGDASLSPDGSRENPFPGWDGHHPFLEASDPHTGYESHFFFCPTFRGKGENKKLKKENGACYPKGMKWITPSSPAAQQSE